MKKFFVPILLSAALLFACDKKDDNNPKSIQLGEAFTLKINETAELDSDGMKITLLDITEDSRCPTGVSCIWEGRVVAEFKVEKDGEMLIKSATDNPQDLSDGTISNGFEAFGHTVTMEEVTPYPVGTEPIDKADYKVKIVVE
jgi:hypothetical protein